MSSENEPCPVRSSLLEDPRIARNERRKVHQHPAVPVRGYDLATPQDRTGERLANRASFVRVAAHGPVPEIDLFNKHPPTYTPQTDQTRRTNLAPIETHVIRPEPGHQTLDVEISVPGIGILGRRQFQVDLATLTIDVKRHEPFEPLETLDLFTHSGQSTRFFNGIRREGKRADSNNETGRKENAAHRSPNARSVPKAYHRRGRLKRSATVMVTG